MTDSAATPKFLASTIDCVDLEAMTEFWSSLLDVEYEIHEPFGFLAPSEGRRVTLWIQRVPEARVGKNRDSSGFRRSRISMRHARGSSN